MTAVLTPARFSLTSCARTPALTPAAHGEFPINWVARAAKFSRILELFFSLFAVIANHKSFKNDLAFFIA